MDGLRDLTIGIVLVLVPLTWLCARFMWRLADEVDEDARAEGDMHTFRLSQALAVFYTAASIAVTLMAIPTVAYLAGLNEELVNNLRALGIVGFNLLLLAMTLPAAYLKLRQRRDAGS